VSPLPLILITTCSSQLGDSILIHDLPQSDATIILAGIE